jgi:hypothetical protein
MTAVWKRWWFWLSTTLLAGSLALLTYCRSHRVWSVNEWRVYQAMDQECHPVWRDFHYRRIRAGDPVNEVIASTPPVRIDRNGRWVVLKYHPRGLCFTGLTAVAYDGQMVGAFAWSDTWVREFFDIMSEEQRTEFFRQYYDQPTRVRNAIFVR